MEIYFKFKCSIKKLKKFVYLFFKFYLHKINFQNHPSIKKNFNFNHLTKIYNLNKLTKKKLPIHCSQELVS